METKTITAGLYSIVKSLSESFSVERAVDESCKLLGLPKVERDGVNYHDDAGEHDVYCTYKWNGKSYQSYAYRNDVSGYRKALESLYQMILRDIMVAELAKTP